MSNKTHLYQKHIDAKAKIVNFGGWLMPIHYGSQIDEHHLIRQNAGIFDVSHMTILDISGKHVKDYLEYVLANDINKIVSTPGKALYSCLLNKSGNVIDDLIVYFMNNNWFRMIVNASTREKDIQWLENHISNKEVNINERDDLAMIAIQGPDAVSIANTTIGIKEQIKPFTAIEKKDLFIARTGYTGEDGYEIIAPADQANDFWDLFLQAGVKPCGLGARDTLRMEAGMNLYGNDMDETTSPLESGLGWTIAYNKKSSNEEHQFIGRKALLKKKASGIRSKLVGLVLQDKGILRAHQSLVNTDQSHLQGEVTSGGFSPTMGKSIGFARIPVEWEVQCLVQIRKKQIPAKIVKLPFVRQGKILVD